MVCLHGAVRPRLRIQAGLGGFTLALAAVTLVRTAVVPYGMVACVWRLRIFGLKHFRALHAVARAGPVMVSASFASPKAAQSITYPTVMIAWQPFGAFQ